MTSHDSESEPEEIIWEGRFVVAKKRGRWEYVSRARGIHAAVILAIDEEDYVIMVEQYRMPLGRPCIELPAGLVGDSEEFEGEDVATAAVRELEEETGYRAARMDIIGEFHSSPGMLTESFTLLRAHGLKRVGDGGGTESEDITVHRVPLGDVASAVAKWRAQGFAIDVKLLLVLAPGILAAYKQD